MTAPPSATLRGMATPAVPPPVSRVPRGRLAALVVAVVVLTVTATLLGARDWAVPERVPGGWQVAAVPGSLTALLAVTSGVCLLLAALLTAPAARLRWTEPAGLAWLAVVLAATGALVFNALVSAANAEFTVGAVIPVLHWLFTLVPALLAGAVTAGRGAAAAAVGALGSGVVTVPLFALGWALMVSREPLSATVPDTLWVTAVLGAVPLGIAVLLARGWGRTREWRDGAQP
jgi:hypothetical protein